MRDIDVDVLVVGAGPVGLTAAYLLRRLGLTVEIVDRRDGPQRAPAAHVVNARTFEIWRQARMDVDRLRALAQDPADAGMVHWVDRLGGTVLGGLPYEQQGDDTLAVTPTPLRNLSQHRLEPALVDELAGIGQAVGYGSRWQRACVGPDAVVSEIDDGASDRRVTSRWLLGCDGAGSPVRRSLGIEAVGPARLQTFRMVHFTADLRRTVADHRGVLYWICDEDAGGAFVSHDRHREWVYMRPLDPETEDATLTAEDAAQLVRAALAEPDVDLEVLNVSSWAMTSQVAERYRAGRALLVGDAAHRFPPTGGLGLNTGIQDAHNLAWKLAAVTRGSAPDALVDTYETERRPIALRNADVSLTNALRMVEVPVALAAGGDVPAAIAAQATHFDMLGLQLGYRYGAADGGVPDDAIRVLTPRAEVGARLPHGWIERDGVRCSTLDLVPLDRAVEIGGPECAEPDALRAGRDFADPHDWWGNVVALPPTGRLRVRPDQHVEGRWE